MPNELVTLVCALNSAKNNSFPDCRPAIHPEVCARGGFVPLAGMVSKEIRRGKSKLDLMTGFFPTSYKKLAT